MSAINVGEVYYFQHKKHAAAAAEYWRATAPTMPITIEVPNLDDIWNAARLKGRYPIAYGDAFAAALAQKYNCPIVTGDPELLVVDDLQVDWIGNRE
jgi:ribonuclease VapC